VTGEDSISRQARIYAEYRLFAALSQAVDTERVRHARLILRHTKHGPACDRVSCTVFVVFEGGGTLRMRTLGDHPYAAINRAVERLRQRSWREEAS
jgi:ribosome-associated translation inhibitor RaiA